MVIIKLKTKMKFEYGQDFSWNEDFFEDLEPICKNNDGFILEGAQQLFLNSLLLLSENWDRS